MGPYIFVIATVLAITPILVLFKIAMGRFKENPEQMSHIQSKFFIGVALSEAIPLIVIVYGFTNITTVATIEEVYAPGLIIILFAALAAFFIFLQRAVDITDEVKQAANFFALLALALSTSIPIISIVALLTMIP